MDSNKDEHNSLYNPLNQVAILESGNLFGHEEIINQEPTAVEVPDY